MSAILCADASAQTTADEVGSQTELIPVSSENRLTDIEVNRRIDATFSQIEALKSVDVRVQDGVVLLSGTVSNNADAVRAGELASRFEGVIAVDDGIVRSLDIEANVTPLIQKFKLDVSRWIQATPLLLLALFVFGVVAFLSHRLAKWSKLWMRISPNPFLGELMAQAVRVSGFVVGLILALNLIGASALIGTILGGAGMVGLAIGFAVRDTLENYISSIMLSIRQPFRANDHVVIEGNEGRVARLTSRATVLMTLDGNHLRIPNSTVFKSVILNYTRNPERRFDFDLGIDADDDPIMAMTVGLDAMRALPFVLPDPEPTAIIKTVGDSNIVVTFMGWINQSSSDFGKSRSLAIRAVKTVLEEQGFTLPEPIYRLRFDNQQAARQIAETAESPKAHVAAEAPRRPAATSESASQLLDVSPDDYLEQKVNSERASDTDSDLLDSDRPVE
ncbi:MAG: mechanosensitive ion channel domain-containing protein [Woeseiaceae bacterium]